MNLQLRFEFGTENIIKTTVCRAHRRRRTRRPGRVLCACARQGSAHTGKSSVARRHFHPKCITSLVARTCHKHRGCPGHAVRGRQAMPQGAKGCAVCGVRSRCFRCSKGGEPSETTVLLQDCNIASPYPLPPPHYPSGHDVRLRLRLRIFPRPLWGAPRRVHSSHGSATSSIMGWWVGCTTTYTRAGPGRAAWSASGVAVSMWAGRSRAWPRHRGEQRRAPGVG